MISPTPMADKKEKINEELDQDEEQVFDPPEIDSKYRMIILAAQRSKQLQRRLLDQLVLRKPPRAHSTSAGVSTPRSRSEMSSLPVTRRGRRRSRVEFSARFCDLNAEISSKHRS